MSKFWAYLWGIETNVKVEEEPELHSFEPTYEELKLTSRAMTATTQNGFEPTYEELKHPW